MSKFVGIIIGGLEILVGAILVAAPGAQPLGAYLIASGVGMVLTGIGSLLSQGPLNGTSTLSRNSVAPWNVIYGRQKVGGILVFINEFDENNKFLDLISVLACHACEGDVVLLFDGQRVPLDANGCSFEPTQETISFVSVTRANGIVTVELLSPITGLETGDTLLIQNVSDGTFNGRYAITVIDSLTFSYICGGSAVTVTGSGDATTTWPNYKALVHMEVLLGDHTATFPGMLTGTPYDGDPGNLVINPNNPWTADHKLLGKTSAFLRLHYSDEVFTNGLPTIAFRLSGKKDIYDPRTSPATYSYSENPALCIADYLAQPVWGFHAFYGTEVPLDRLISAANMCDEAVPLAAGGSEARYRCNGGFPLTVKRGEVLQNLLTSCGGRLTYSQGKFVIWPAAWGGVNFFIGAKAIASATLKVLTSHLFGGAGNGNVTAGDNVISSPTVVIDPSDWTLRTDSLALVSPTAETLNSLEVWCRNWDTATSDISGYFHDIPGPCRFLIYDCWLELVYADGSTSLWRPSVARVNHPDPGGGGSIFGGAGGVVTDAEAACDGDPTTCATIDRNAFRSLADYNICAVVLSRFVPVGGSSGLPDTSATAMAESAKALDIAAGPFRWREKVSIRDRYNGVKGTYISPANNWQSSDIPPYAQDEAHGYLSGSPMVPLGDANLAADGGVRSWLDIQLPFTISVATAQRLCKIELMRRRQQGTGTFSYNLAMYKATVLDVVQMTLPLLGWANKLLEIAAHRFTITKQQIDGVDVTLLGTEIDVQETDPAQYDWSVTEELSAQGFQQTSLPGSIDGGGATLVSYANYANTPAIALTQPDATHIDLAAVSVTFPSKTATYNARSIVITDPAGVPTWYYVTLADPDYTGDQGVSTDLAVYAETTTAKVGAPGYVYMGAIQCTHAALSTATPLPGGWPAPQSFMVGA